MFRQTAPEFVIVDEAHTCTQMGSGKQRRWQLVKALSEDTNRHMVLATATPHSGNQLGFANLLSLLKPEFAAFAEGQHPELRAELVNFGCSAKSGTCIAVCGMELLRVTA